MALNLAGASNITIAGTIANSINATGQYFYTNRPYFWVSQSASPTAINNDIIFNSVGMNVGSHYNTTNGRFTAPIAGVYHFTYRQLSQNANPAGNYVPQIFINGVALLPGYEQKRLANTWHSIHFQTTVNMNANDYVTMRWSSAPAGATTYTDPNYVQFSGHLVG